MGPGGEAVSRLLLMEGREDAEDVASGEGAVNNLVSNENPGKLSNTQGSTGSGSGNHRQSENAFYRLPPLHKQGLQMYWGSGAHSHEGETQPPGLL